MKGRTLTPFFSMKNHDCAISGVGGGFDGKLMSTYRRVITPAGNNCYPWVLVTSSLWPSVGYLKNIPAASITTYVDACHYDPLPRPCVGAIDDCCFGLITDDLLFNVLLEHLPEKHRAYMREHFTK